MRWLFAFIPAIWSCLLSAQLVAPQFRRVSMLDGLTSNHVLSLTSDGRGHLWVGTADGLNRFDGRRVKTYRYESRPDALPGDIVTALAWDRSRYLYVGTNAPFLTLLDPLADTLARIPLPVPDYSQHGEQRVTAVHVDLKGRVWVGHGARCLSLFDPATRGFVTREIAPPMPTPRSREVISGMIEDEAGILWLSTFQGLVRFDPEALSATPIELHAAKGQPGAGYAFQVRGMVDDDSALVIGTWSEGIFRMRKADGELHRLWPVGDHTPTFVDHMVQDLLRVGDKVYVATIDQGLLLLDLRTGRVDHYDRSLDEETCRKHADLFNGAARLLQLDDGLCLGSYTQGLALIPTHGALARAVHLPDDPPTELIDEVLDITRVDGTGQLLALSHRRGLFVYDTLGAMRELIASHNDRARRYLQFTVLQDGRVLIASMPDLVLADPRSGSMGKPAFVQAGTACAGPVWWTRGDGRNGLWCMTGSKGLFHLDTLTRACRPIAEVLPDVAALLSNWPWDVFKDLQGRTWFLSATSPPVVRYPDGHVEKLVAPADLGPFEVSDIAQTPDGHCWLVVKHMGLVRVDAASPVNGPMILEDVSARLPTRNLEGLVAMKDGTLWIRRHTGLMHWDPVTGHARLVSRADGLPVSPLTLDHGAVPLRPPLLVGTWEGFVQLSETASRPTRPPAVQVPAMAAIDSTIARDPDLAPGLEHIVRHDQNRITFFLRSTNLFDPHRDEYAYRLIGSDTAWIVIQPDDRLTFNSLAPGTYQLELKARTNQGDWGAISAVRLKVLPPWWATWWFRGLIVVLLIVVIWVVFRIVLRVRLARQRAALERERTLLEERMRIAHDLHDDLGSSLALIAMEGELARMDDGSDTRDALRRVSEGAREVTDNMRRIVWALGSGQDTLGDLAAYIRSSAVELMERADLELDARVDIATPRLKLSADQRRHLLLITKELLLNVVKHAEACNATLLMAQQNGSLALTVADDGRGFDTATRVGTGTGTTSLRERVNALGGTLDIRSAPGEGTTVDVKIPLTAPTV